MINFIKRVVILHGRRTSICLCENEWLILENICRRENLRRNKLLSLIELNKAEKLGFTSAVRLFMLTYLHTVNPQIIFAQNNSQNLVSLFNNIK